MVQFERKRWKQFIIIINDPILKMLGPLLNNATFCYAPCICFRSPAKRSIFSLMFKNFQPLGIPRYFMKCLNKPCFGCSHFLPTGKEGSEDFGGVIVTSTCFSHKALYVPYSPLLATTYSPSVSHKNHVIPTKILHYPLPPLRRWPVPKPLTPISNVSFSLLSTINFLECKFRKFSIGSTNYS